MDMKTMNAGLGIRQLVLHEGLRLLVYDDATGKPLKPGDTLVGYPTIGYGRELSKTGISEAEARSFLMRDVMRVASALKSDHRSADIYPFLCPPRRWVLKNMAYNLGLEGLFGFKKMWLALEEGRFADAALEMLDSKWATQVGVRSIELAEQMKTGVWHER